MKRLPKSFGRSTKIAFIPQKRYLFYDINVPLKIFEVFSRQFFNLVDFPLPWKENGMSAKAV